VPTPGTTRRANCEKIKAAGTDAASVPAASTGPASCSSWRLLQVQKENPGFAADFDANKAKYATDPAAFKAFRKMAEVYEKGF
jgi:raffinose/stachyose/melibiose transport system substrate-binding protein